MFKMRRKKWIAAAALSALLSSQVGAPLCYAQGVGEPAADNSNKTTTPIKHVMLIIGENRTFDNIFGTFKPENTTQTVWNLLSEGIVNADGSPGPNFDLAEQWQANDTGSFSINPSKTSPYTYLPPPNTDGAPTDAPFTTVAEAEAVEPALETPYYDLLTIGGTGLSRGVIDTRFNDGTDIPDGPFPLTSSYDAEGGYSAYNTSVTYDDYTGSPVHRFFQMWQELDCSMKAATTENPSGCQSDLWPWVETTVGVGSNGKPQPMGFNDETTGEGSIAMGFYNIANGLDVSYFTQLANEYTLSDNYHQAIMGGTGANHVAIGYGGEIFYAGPNGAPATPPTNQIENPNPQSGTNNYYIQDGYSGGSYVDCADKSAPGVAPVMTYLDALPYKVFKHGDCRTNAYYLVNNYNPGYLGDGTPAPLGPNDFTVPPSQQNNIGLELSEHKVSWKYYGEGWADGTENGENGSYCNICDPFLYSKQIMTNPAERSHLTGIQALYSDIQSGNLPAVSIVKPDGYLDGHPASSKFELFEQFCHKIIDMVKANPSLWKDTAIMITVDEGGGYYDSGYVQPLDFFGDGTRIPLLVVSPYSTGGYVVHTYEDHVSFDKFVEANWKLGPISSSSRDNLPNPTPNPSGNPYVPGNSPAIGNLMSMFHFGS